MSPAKRSKISPKKEAVPGAPAASTKRPKASVVSGDRKNKKKRNETFSLYIYKVLKQVHSDIGISKKAMDIMNSFVHDIFERIALESSKLVRYNKRRTLTSKEIQTSVKLLLPGELARHAVAEGSKAISKFSEN